MLEKHNLSSWQFNDRKHCTDFNETDNKVGECSGVILTEVFKLCVSVCFLSLFIKKITLLNIHLYHSSPLW